MKSYPLGTFAKIFGFLFSAGAMAGAVFAVNAAMDTTTTVLPIVLYIVAIACTGAAIFLFREMQISRFIIALDHVSLISMIYKRKLFFHQIAGWNDEDHEIHILPNDPSLKEIRVSHYFKEFAEIRYFLETQFPNVDRAELQSQEDEILENEAFGATVELRAQRLEQARKIASYATRTGWVLAIWLFFYPVPYNVSVITGMVFPLLLIALCYQYRGLFRGDESKTSAYPSVVTPFIVVSLMLTIRALSDINILSYSNGWLPIGLATAGVFVLYGIPTGVFQPRKTTQYVALALLPLFTFCYSFGSITLLNSVGDTSKSETYATFVVKKYVSEGKRKTYHLELAKWADLTENLDIKVSREKYEGTSVGDSQTVHHYPGMFRMPWIEVE